MFPMVRRLSSTPREAFGPLITRAGGGDGISMGCSVAPTPRWRPVDGEEGGFGHLVRERRLFDLRCVLWESETSAHDGRLGLCMSQWERLEARRVLEASLMTWRSGRFEAPQEGRLSCGA